MFLIDFLLIEKSILMASISPPFPPPPLPPPSSPSSLRLLLLLLRLYHGKRDGRRSRLRLKDREEAAAARASEVGIDHRKK